MSLAKIDIADYDYALPESLIAQHPAVPRDTAKLCVWNRGKIEHKVFSDIVSYFRAGDCLIVNNTRVIPARLVGNRKSGGKVEVFLLEKGEGQDWIVLGKPGRALKKGETVYFDENVTATVLAEPTEEGKRILRFSHDQAAIYKIGRVPLPPYIKRDAEPGDSEHYQTIYAHEDGAVAAPTAGLHFTDDVFQALKDKGVRFGTVTLHVGLGTFKPVTTVDATEHKMDKEWFSVPTETCELVNKTRAEGGRVFAAGTTSAKALETAAQAGLPLLSRTGRSDLFIYPPYKFKVVDALITNFHIPKSTLLLLVSSLIGRESVMRLYDEAIKGEYRFLSYGDATLLLT